MKRFVTASLAIFLLVAGLFAVNVGTAQQASAAQVTRHVGEQMRNYATDACLAADYANIYSYNCSVSNQKWTTLMRSNNDFRLRNEATGQCLANLDYYTVYMTSCGSAEPGIWWHADYAGTARSFIVNTHINRYLSTDFSKKVYLADRVSNQNWRWQPPIVASPVDCLAAWDANDEYVTVGWVDAKVADVNGVFLGCGDERSGIIHITGTDTTGNGHPITAETQESFLRCFGNVVRLGNAVRDIGFPTTRTRYVWTYLGPEGFSSARVIRDNARRFVWQMSTVSVIYPDGNDWVGCANSVA